MKIKILRNTLISGRQACAGGVELVTEKEARDLIAANKARHLTGADSKPSVAVLKGTMTGRIVALLGGGPSLPSDLKTISHLEPYLIGVNHHAQLNGHPCDAIVFFDDPRQTNSLAAAAKDAPVVVTPYGDYATHLLDVKYVNYGMTAGLGVWLANYMGADAVYLCGMDCYTGATTYFYQKGQSEVQDLDAQLTWWKKLQEQIDGVKIYSVSGPLTDVFVPYKAKPAQAKAKVRRKE